MIEKTFKEIEQELTPLLQNINEGITPLVLSDELLRIYYYDKSILDIKVDEEGSYILEDYLGNLMVSDINSLYKNIEKMLLTLNFIKEGFLLEEKRRDSMKMKHDSKPLYEELLDIDFDEFDEVIAKEVIAKKTDEEDYSDIMIEFPEEDDGYLDIEDLDIEDEDSEESEDTSDDSDADVPEEDEPEQEPIIDTPETHEETLEEEDGDAPVGECVEPEKKIVSTKTKSLSDMYESKRTRQKNRIVEALLVDDAVEDIERTLKSTLDAHGISAAQRIVVLGLILDRMLHASDDEVQAPEYLNDMIGEMVDDEDIAKMIRDTVEKVLSGESDPKVTDYVDEVQADIITKDGIEEITAETPDSEEVKEEEKSEDR